MKRPKVHRGTDKLVAEAERLRRELARTAARVGEFSEILSGDARVLMYETAYKEGVDHGTEDEPRAPGSSGDAGAERLNSQPDPGGGTDPDRD